MSTETRQGTKKLADAMRAAILAVGQAASTETGKMLFALAYDADCMLDWQQDRARNFSGKRPTKASQECKYFEGMDLGVRRAFVRALAYMASEMSGHTASVDRCRYVINAEIDAMKNRTEAEKMAAPIGSLFAQALEY